MKKSVRSGFVLLVFVISLHPVRTEAADFTGRVIIHMQNELDTMHLFVKGDTYLLQGTMDSMNVSVLADRSRQILDAWSPSEKEYHEDSLADLGAALMDPFAAINVVSAMSKRTPIKEGTETVEGYAADKYAIHMEDGTKMMDYWVATKLGFPIKIVEPGDGAMTLTVDQIQEVPVDAALMRLPAGMTRAVEPGEEPPAWSAEVAKVPVVEIPYSKEMAAGDIIRIRPKIGERIEVVCDRAVDSTQFCGTAFKQGTPTGNVMLGTFNLDSGQNWTEQFEPFSTAEDEIVVRMNKGKGHILVREAKPGK